jgi:hypothetical protein
MGSNKIRDYLFSRELTDLKLKIADRYFCQFFSGENIYRITTLATAGVTRVEIFLSSISDTWDGCYDFLKTISDTRLEIW